MKARLILTVIFLLVSSVCVSAKDEWILVKSPNFNLIGNAGEKDIRKVATRLEQFREAFKSMFGNTKIKQSIETNVIVFKNKKSQMPFLPKRADGKADKWIAGFFQAGEDVNYISISMDGEDSRTFETIFHEYIHFIVNTNFGKSSVPPWFNEGLAEFYSTFQIEDDIKVSLGIPDSSHLNLLSQHKLIGLDQFFSIDSRTLHANGHDSRNIFYAQAWALLHYLIQNGQNDQLDNFLSSVLGGTPNDEAFANSFGRDYKTMEKELKEYVKQYKFPVRIVTFVNPLEFNSKMTVDPLTEPMAKAYLGDLLYHMNYPIDAEAVLMESLNADPENALANTTMGLIKMRESKPDEARAFLEKAIKNGANNYYAQFSYAYALSKETMKNGFVTSFTSEKTEKMRESLKRAITLNPNYSPAYELLGFIDIVNGTNLDESLEFLKKALSIQPGNQNVSLQIANIYLRKRHYNEAERIAKQILKTTGDEKLRFQAENITSITQNMRGSGGLVETSQAANGESSSKNTQPPKSTRRATSTQDEENEEIKQARINRSLNSGLPKLDAGEKQIVVQLGKISCPNGTVRYQVVADGKKLTFASKDFLSVDLINFSSSSGEIELACNADLRNYYAVLNYKKSSKPNVAGEISHITFVPSTFRLMSPEELAAPLQP